MALAVPLSRFTSRVGGGSAFYVRPHSHVMPISRRTKSILWLIVALLVAGAAWVSYNVHYAWHKFVIEDQVHGTFFPVVTALYKFQEDSGTTATNLLQLVPRYVSQIPTSPVVDSVTYRVLPDGTNWQLSVFSRALKPPRVYMHRSSGNYTPEEDRQELTSFHLWHVFRQQ